MALAAFKQKHTIDLERHEAKYIIHPDQMAAIREFIRPFCAPDENARDGTNGLPEYLVTTLQLDTPSLALFYAKEYEALNRFKLRIRTYGTDGSCPVFLEVKRKIKGIIVKSRSTIPSRLYNGELVSNPKRRIPFRSAREEANYMAFVQLTRELGAGPVCLIRYTRESYLGKYDNYSRLTFDRKLCYRPTRDWALLPPGGHWWAMDSATAFNRNFGGVILELKTFSDAPMWMVDMVERFDLVRVGFCKYVTAIRLEKLFQGAQYSDGSENCGDEW
jgi:hypothetical protein